MHDMMEYLRIKVRILRSALLTNVAEHKQESDLRELISQILEYYTSSLPVSTPEDAFAVVSGKNNASLEAAFTWFGGWRPTSAIVLVISTMDIERKQEAVNCNVLYSPIPLLSERQLYNINTLEAHMRQAECDLSNRLALLQMLVADQNMITAISTGNWSKTKEALQSKIADLRNFLVEANNLRLQTLHVLFTILDPIQAAKCTIAAFEVGYSVKTLKECLSKGRLPSSRITETTNVSDENLLNVNRASTCQGKVSCSSAYGRGGSNDNIKLFQKFKTADALCVKVNNYSISLTCDSGKDHSANFQNLEAFGHVTESLCLEHA